MQTKKCNACKIENEGAFNEPVPYIVYETAMARNAREKRGLFIAIIVLIALIFLTNVGWLVYESQFDAYTYYQDGGGVNNVNSGEQGDVINEPGAEN